jgi:RimJ/RimL family protein N-acetyltransferase
MTSSIVLRPLEGELYQSWFAEAVAGYADDNIKSGRWTEAEALQQSMQEFQKLLPDGPATSKQHLYSIVEVAGDTPVGVIWFAEEEGRGGAFIYDLMIFEPYRRRGYAEQAMRAIEPLVRALALDHLGLHVFGVNAPARTLYRKLGYVETNVIMRKDLA